MTVRQKQRIEKGKYLVREWLKDLLKAPTLIIVIGFLWMSSKKTYYTISYGVALVDTIHQNASNHRRLEWKVDTLNQSNNVRFLKLEKRVEKLQAACNVYACTKPPFNLADLGIVSF